MLSPSTPFSDYSLPAVSSFVVTSFGEVTRRMIGMDAVVATQSDGGLGAPRRVQ